MYGLPGSDAVRSSSRTITAARIHTSTPIPVTTQIAFTPTLTPLPPTATSVTSTPTARCFWMYAYRAAPPEIEAEAQRLFSATGVRGTLVVGGFGETFCDEFHLRQVDFEFRLQVNNLTDQLTMSQAAARVASIPGQATLNKKSLGTVRIRFEAGNKFCWWEGDRCGETMRTK